MFTDANAIAKTIAAASAAAAVIDAVGVDPASAVDECAVSAFSAAAATDTIDTTARMLPVSTFAAAEIAIAIATVTATANAIEDVAVDKISVAKMLLSWSMFALPMFSLLTPLSVLLNSLLLPSNRMDATARLLLPKVRLCSRG